MKLSSGNAYGVLQVLLGALVLLAVLRGALVVFSETVEQPLQVPGLSDTTLKKTETSLRKLRRVSWKAALQTARKGLSRLAPRRSVQVPGLSRQTQTDMLTIVVVGGGPTGVETAAEIHDFLTEDLADKCAVDSQHIVGTPRGSG